MSSWKITGVNPKNEHETYIVEAKDQWDAVKEASRQYPDLAVTKIERCKKD